MAHHEGKKKAGAEDAALKITRVFDAPREKVWKVWTDPESVKRWWGPQDFSAPVIKIDLRVGGKFLGDMRGPDGKDYWSVGTYREVKPMERIVATDSFADEKGNVVPASQYGMNADLPLELLLTTTFEDVGDKTRLTLKHEGFPPGQDKELARQGWEQSLDKLAKLL